MSEGAELIEAARGAMTHAHAPYSGFAVGAAVRLRGGQIVTGSNFENASYGLSLCAEAVALAAANTLGRLHEIEAIAVAGGRIAPDGSIAGGAVVTPCGRCRQMLNEAEEMAGRPLAIYCGAAEGSAMSEHRVAELLPFAFGPAGLGIKAGKN